MPFDQTSERYRRPLPLRNMFAAFLRFSRPHTIAGTTLSVAGLYLIALAGSGSGDLEMLSLVLALISCLGANIYIVGLNQITDIGIDRINKPDLPMVSGAFSLTTGRLIIISALALSLIIAVSEGIFLLITVILSVIIGTLYSLPPVRLKRFHFWAAACIITVRGLLVNVFLFLHFNTVLNQSPAIPLRVWILTLFVFGISLVIAWFKDLPDMEGDRRFRIATLSLQLGPGRVFRLGLGLLYLSYMIMITAGLTGIPGVNNPLLVISHFFLIAVLWFRSRTVDPESKESVSGFYQFIWRLFFSEYILFPVACLAV